MLTKVFRGEVLNYSGIHSVFEAFATDVQQYHCLGTVGLERRPCITLHITTFDGAIINNWTCGFRQKLCGANRILARLKFFQCHGYGGGTVVDIYEVFLGMISPIEGSSFSHA